MPLKSIRINPDETFEVFVEAGGADRRRVLFEVNGGRGGGPGEGRPTTSGAGLTDGTVALPGLYFIADTNTGLFRTASDNFRLVAGGVNQLDVAPTSLAFGGVVVAGAGNTFNNTQGRGFVTAVGVETHVPAQTINDSAAAATIAIAGVSVWGIPTFTATNARTYTDAATVYIAGAPVAGAGVTITNTALSLWVDAGNVRFDGVILNAIGTAAAPSYTFLGNTNTGIYSAAANQVWGAIAGVDVFVVKATGLALSSTSENHATTAGTFVGTFKGGTAPAGTIGTASSIYASTTAMRKIIAAGTDSLIET